ncbi:hypothetical protein Syun_017099 [Stephania yunnanensis]|uniref:Uncharacterized protein n=1 Tax=Stephania yunnanensis TaxID=152371 RepID=A0AAP0P221_9MAGN
MTFIDTRSERFYDRLRMRRLELTQATPDQPVDYEAMYFNVAGECPKERVYSLGSLGRKKRRYADPGASTSQMPEMVPRAEFDIVAEQLRKLTADVTFACLRYARFTVEMFVKVPSAWRQVLEDPSNLQIFFDYYAIAKPPISKELVTLDETYGYHVRTDPRLTDYDTLLENIPGLKEGKPAQVPIYDFKSNSRTGYGFASRSLSWLHASEAVKVLFN